MALHPPNVCIPLLIHLILATLILPSLQNIGYIGPACAVTEDSLFMHGVFVRKLSPGEINEFHKYQGALDVLRLLHEAVVTGTASVSPNSSLLFGPEVPSFCNGLDGTIEVVLNGCIVRKNQVFMAGRIVRSLTTGEKQKIDSLIGGHAKSQWILEKNSPQMANGKRTKRMDDPQKESSSSSPNSLTFLSGTQNDFTGLLSHFLNINASVAERFVPMAKSPAFLDRLNDNLAKALMAKRNEKGSEKRTRRRKIVENWPQEFDATTRTKSPTEAADAQMGMPAQMPPSFPIEPSAAEVEWPPASFPIETSSKRRRRQSKSWDFLPLQTLRAFQTENGNNKNIQFASAALNAAPSNDATAAGTAIPHLIIPIEQPSHSALVSSYNNQLGYTTPTGNFWAAPPSADYNQQQLSSFGASQPHQFAHPSTVDDQTYSAAPVQQMHVEQTSHQFLQMPSASNFGQIKPGETVQLGGQTYVAVPVGHSMFQQQYPSLPHPLNSLGLMPAANSQQQQQSIESQQQPQQQQQQQQQQQELELGQAHPQFSTYPQHSTSNQAAASLFMPETQQYVKYSQHQQQQPAAGQTMPMPIPLQMPILQNVPYPQMAIPSSTYYYGQNAALLQATYGQQQAAYPPAYQIYAYGNAIEKEGHLQMAQQQNYAAPTKIDEVDKTEDGKRIGTEGWNELPNEICQIPAPY